MTVKDTGGSRPETHLREHPNLEHQYGNIGISAVAAALRYQGGRNPAYAPATPQDEQAPPRRLPDAA